MEGRNEVNTCITSIQKTENLINMYNSNLHLNDVEISLNVLLTRRMATVTDSGYKMDI